MDLPKLTCEKCGHVWIPRVPNPIKCSKCGHIIGTRVFEKQKNGDKPNGKFSPNRTADT